ncbi:MAG TPA: hypothetical protein VMR41_04155 [Patescibacteria group bacterium]|jgi:Zn ribbon nucleic-acid-binding protein|nr:hypothetical protein [Patescibacteria group bacterium]
MEENDEWEEENWPEKCQKCGSSDLLIWGDSYEEFIMKIECNQCGYVKKEKFQ